MDIWKIDESEDFYAGELGFSSDIKNDIKRLEHLAGRYLLKYQNKEINFNHLIQTVSNKPIMSCGSFEFSLSHSYPYVACASHPFSSVGIDIQMIREKVMVIQDKFLQHAEKEMTGGDIGYTSLIWSAKEALFKYVGTGGQEFKSDFIIRDISRISSEKYSIDAVIFPDSAEPRNISLYGIISDEFSLAFTVPE